MLRRFALFWIIGMAASHAFVGLREHPLSAPARGEHAAAAGLAARAALTAVPEREPEPPASALELRVWAELEAQLVQEARLDRVATTDGRVLLGRVIEQTPSAVRLLRSFGDSGAMQISLPRAQIASITHQSAPVPELTLRDVRFRLEFPEFNLYRRPPFTIVTDQRFFAVEDAVQTLEELHGDVLTAFGPLLERAERGDGIQLLFFSDEAQFTAYRDEYAPALGYASGFYSTRTGRLVLFDQSSAQWVASASRGLDEERERYAAPARAQGAQLALHEWHTSARRQLQGAALRANRSILRHEGAHQLFHAYGVHSDAGNEPLWLVEGLASYLEARAGEPAARAAELRAAAVQGPPLAFAELIDYPSRSGFGALGSEVAVSAAYAQSWFVVAELLRTDREAFFEYVRIVRDPARLAQVPEHSHFELLARLTGRSPEALERELGARLARL